MNLGMKFVAEALSLSEPAAKKLFRRSILKRAFIPHSFFLDIKDAYLLEKKFGKFESGTVIVQLKDGNTVIARGFPKIRRTLMLSETIKKYFKGEMVSVEEKINGYNVRILKFGKNLYAITRRGYICPYTTEKVREKFELDFFKDFPEMMICCEAAGLESPYVSKEVYGKGLEFYVFDIRNSKTNEAIDVESKMKICDEYGFNLAKVFGIERDEELIDLAFKAIKKLDKDGREGIVLKDVKMRLNPIKYTTSFCNCSDVRYAFKFFNDYGRDFFVTRTVREGFQSYEFNEDVKEREKRYIRLGKAIIDGLLECIEDVKKYGYTSEKFKLRFKSLEVFNLYVEHMKKLTNAKFSEPIFDELTESYIVYMEKKANSTSDRVKNLISGGFW